MPEHFLAIGNTEFADSVSHTGKHHKSGWLKEANSLTGLLKAVTECQKAKNLLTLTALFEAMHGWLNRHPTEYKKRGDSMRALWEEAYEAAAILDSTFDPAAFDYPDDPVAYGQSKAAAMDLARAISVKHSDVLITNSYGYNIVEGVKQSPYQTPPFDSAKLLELLESLYNWAAGIAAKYDRNGNHQINSQYQIDLGKNASKKRMILWDQFKDVLDSDARSHGNADKKREAKQVLDNINSVVNLPRLVKLGRCFTCAAAVVYELISDPEFCNLRLPVEVCTTSRVQHYFVVIGRNTRSDINAPGSWGPGAFIVDIWDANGWQAQPLVKRTTDNQFLRPGTVEPNDWNYIGDAEHGALKVVCRMVPGFNRERAKVVELDD